MLVIGRVWSNVVKRRMAFSRSQLSAERLRDQTVDLLRHSNIAVMPNEVTDKVRLL